MSITNDNLKKKSYTSQQLIENIDNLDLDIILENQKLEIKFIFLFFIVEYLLNEKYQVTSTEKNIDFYSVIFFQPHIDKNELESELKKFYR